MKKKKLFPMGISEAFKQVLAFIALILVIFAMCFCAAIVSSCSPQNVHAASQEEMIFELKCKLENQQKLVKAYGDVLHEVWLDKPAYVEDALAEGDAFIHLDEIMGENDVFRFRNKQDSIRYMNNWYGGESSW